MKKFCFIFIIFLPLHVSAQLHKSSGIPLYVNFLAGVQTDVVLLDKQITPLAGINAAFQINNNVYFGVFGEFKFLKLSSNLITYPDHNFNYTNLGLLFGMQQGLGVKKTGFGYVKRKARLNYSLKLGGGRLWMIDPADDSKLGSPDYYYMIVPGIGIEYPFTDKLGVGGGINYRLHLVMTKFYENNQCNNPGVYINLKASLFNTNYIRTKIRPVY